jgi:hypothetical protein
MKKFGSRKAYAAKEAIYIKNNILFKTSVKMKEV